jgi:hypothetical protein
MNSDRGTFWQQSFTVQIDVCRIYSATDASSGTRSGASPGWSIIANGPERWNTAATSVRACESPVVLPELGARRPTTRLSECSIFHRRSLINWPVEVNLACSIGEAQQGGPGRSHWRDQSQHQWLRLRSDLGREPHRNPTGGSRRRRFVAQRRMSGLSGEPAVNEAIN